MTTRKRKALITADGNLSTNPARGVKFPEKELKEAPVLFTAEDFTKLLEHSTNRTARWQGSSRSQG